MIKGILLLTLSLLALLGLCELIHEIRLLFFSSKSARNITALIILREESAVEQLEFAICQLRWMGNKYASQIVALDYGLSEKTRNVCAELSAKHGVVFCRKLSLLRTLDKINDTQLG